MQHIQLPYITICSQVCNIIYNMIQVKLSLYKLGQAPSIPGGSDTQIFRQSAHKGGKVVSPIHRPPLPPPPKKEVILVLISSGYTVDPSTIVRPEELSPRKKHDDSTHNRTRDLTVCSTVPQPTASPHIPFTM